MGWCYIKDETYISGILGETYLTSIKMRKVVMQTLEPVSIIEAIERVVKSLTVPM